MASANLSSGAGGGLVLQSIIIPMDYSKPQFKFRNLTAVRSFSILCVVLGVLSMFMQVLNFLNKLYSILRNNKSWHWSLKKIKDRYFDSIWIWISIGHNWLRYLGWSILLDSRKFRNNCDPKVSQISVNNVLKINLIVSCILKLNYVNVNQHHCWLISDRLPA